MVTDNAGILERFYSKLKTVGDCQIYTGAVSSSGHGSFFIKSPQLCISAHVF